MTKIPTINNALISPSIIGKTISAGNSERCFCSKGSSGALFAIESMDEKKKNRIASYDLPVWEKLYKCRNIKSAF